MRIRDIRDIYVAYEMIVKLIEETRKARKGK